MVAISGTDSAPNRQPLHGLTPQPAGDHGHLLIGSIVGYPASTMTCRVLASNVVLFFLVLAAGRAPAQQEPAEAPRKVVSRSVPEYPPLARTMNISGTVRVEALVAGNGTVKSVELKGGHPVFTQAATNAVRKWKWEPATRETHETVELRFDPLK
jgi:TonB family protein